MTQGFRQVIHMLTPIVITTSYRSSKAAVFPRDPAFTVHVFRTHHILTYPICTHPFLLSMLSGAVGSDCDFGDVHHHSLRPPRFCFSHFFFSHPPARSLARSLKKLVCVRPRCVAGQESLKINLHFHFDFFIPRSPCHGHLDSFGRKNLHPR